MSDLNKIINEYKDPEKGRALAEKIRKDSKRLEGVATFMEVCGTHTMSIARFGIRSLLPKNVRLISGPGCPVCVTPTSYLDAAFEILHQGAYITTFGDMLRVPGNESNLEKERARGADVKVVYSPVEAVELAKQNPDRDVVFLAVGFETTIPTIAGALSVAESEGVENFSILVGHKTVPEALKALLNLPELNLTGFILPGHVSVIIGSNAYKEVLEPFGVPGVVTGFEPLDILYGVSRLVELAINGEFAIENSYPRVVRPEGNVAAQRMIYKFFEPADTLWRGIGTIPMSGLKLRKEYEHFDAATKFGVDTELPERPTPCRCGEVLTGSIYPTDCPLFGKACTPANPVGPCMVSSEGTCAAYYKYGVANP